jgi:hypothetical protein
MLAFALALPGLFAAIPEAAASGVSPLNASAADKKRAQSRYDEGAKLYEAKRYPEALKAFQESYDIVASPNSHLMIARTLREQGQLISAYEEFERAELEAQQLASADPGKYGATVDKSVQDREALKRRLGALTVRTRGDASGAAITIAGRIVPADRLVKPIVVAPGTVEVVGTTQDGRRIARTVTVAAGASQEVEMDFSSPETAGAAPAATSTAAPPATPDRGEPSSGRIPLVPFVLIAGGVAAAGLGVGIIFGLQANSTYDEQEGLPVAERDEDRIDEGKRQQLIANVGFIAGGAAAAIGGALLAIELTQSSKSQSSAKAAPTLGVGWQSVSVRGQF